MFEPFDLQTPQFAVWLGFVFAIAGAAILAHATWRRRRLSAWKAGESSRFEGTDSRGERVDAPRDVKVEAISGIIAMVLGTAGIIFGMISQTQQLQVLEDNTTAKYPQIAQVEPYQWRGNLLEADVVTTDGAEVSVKILFDPATGEPTLQGDYPEIAEVP